MNYDQSHGSPYDRGGADVWYGRTPEPHWYPNGTYVPPRIDLTPDMPEYAAYMAGYDDAMAEGLFNSKKWD